MHLVRTYVPSSNPPSNWRDRMQRIAKLRHHGRVQCNWDAPHSHDLLAELSPSSRCRAKLPTDIFIVYFPWVRFSAQINLLGWIFTRYPASQLTIHFTKRYGRAVRSLKFKIAIPPRIQSHRDVVAKGSRRNQAWNAHWRQTVAIGIPTHLQTWNPTKFDQTPRNRTMKTCVA